jgi:hypothetical protein
MTYETGGACRTHKRDEKSQKNLTREPKGRRQLGDLFVDGRIVLKQIWERAISKISIEFSWFRRGPVSSSCENGNELIGSVNTENFYRS